jgi:O-antigen ligase
MSGTELPQIYHSYFPGQATHAAHSIYAEVLGDSGFVGLTIYLTIIGLAFGYAARIRRSSSGRGELAWASELASAIQLSLVAFCIGGAALSLAYYDQLYLYVGLLSAMLMMANKPATERISALRSGQVEPAAPAPVVPA